jgi:thiamine-phosphate pyrophosphorylase
MRDKRACETQRMAIDDIGAERRARLSAARLYLVCPDSHAPMPGSEQSEAGGAPTAPTGESTSRRRELSDLVHRAVAGGVDIVQLREKHLPDDELVSLAHALRALCERIGALLIVNDRPAVAVEAGAHGVHVGQDDMAVAEARELVGPDMLIGLSTHTTSEIDAQDASQADYIAVGPVHQTPTKPGRPAVGLELVRYAAVHARRPFFAIGGIDAYNLGAVLAAGARRVVVLRAIAAAADPCAAAQELRAQIDTEELDPRSVGA